METVPAATSSSSLHPLFWVAGISVTLLSLVGIAALTGVLPARTAPAPERPAIVAAVPAPQPPAVAAVAPPLVAQPVAQPQAPVAAVSVTPPIPHKTATKKVEHKLPATSTPMPPTYAGGVPPDYVPPVVAAPAPPPCIDCGVIANLREVTHEGKGSGAGAVIGGLAGGVLGSNVGRGNTRTLATIAGAVGGGLLGNSVEKSQSKTVSYEVTVRMEDGSTRMIDSATMPSWRIGDKVKLVNGAIVLR